MPIQQILGPALENVGKAVSKWLQSGGGKKTAQWIQKNGKTVLIAGGSAAAGAAGMAILKESDFKKRIKQVEKDNAIKFDREMKREMEKLRKQYKDNEDQLRRKVNEFLRKKGYNVSF